MKVFPLTSSLLPYPLSKYWANCAQCSKSNWNSGEANQPNDDLTGNSSLFKNTLRLKRISKPATTVLGRRRAISMNFSNRLTKPRRANNQMPWANNKMPWTTSSQQPDALALVETNKLSSKPKFMIIVADSLDTLLTAHVKKMCKCTLLLHAMQWWLTTASAKHPDMGWKHLNIMILYILRRISHLKKQKQIYWFSSFVFFIHPKSVYYAKKTVALTHTYKGIGNDHTVLSHLRWLAGLLIIEHTYQPDNTLVAQWCNRPQGDMKVVDSILGHEFKILEFFAETKPIFTNLKEKIRAHRASSKATRLFLTK